MSWTCALFGHNYSVTSVFGNYAFCSKCGSPLVIKDPFQLQPGERRYIQRTTLRMRRAAKHGSS